MTAISPPARDHLPPPSGPGSVSSVWLLLSGRMRWVLMNEWVDSSNRENMSQPAVVPGAIDGDASGLAGLGAAEGAPTDGPDGPLRASPHAVSSDSMTVVIATTVTNRRAVAQGRKWFRTEVSRYD